MTVAFRAHNPVTRIYARLSRSPKAVRARTLGVLSILLAVGLLGSQNAYAASNVMKDARGDTYGIDQDGEHLIPKPSVKGDITSLRTNHTTHAVNLVLRARELRRSNFAEIDVVTSAAHRRHFMLTAMTFPGSKVIDLTTRSGREITCPGLRGRIDHAEATIRLHVPRACLDNPRWVRTGAMLMTVAQTGEQTMTIDVAGKKVLTERWWDNANHLPYGPRVHVG